MKSKLSWHHNWASINIENSPIVDQDVPGVVSYSQRKVRGAAEWERSDATISVSARSRRYGQPTLRLARWAQA